MPDKKPSAGQSKEPSENDRRNRRTPQPSGGREGRPSPALDTSGPHPGSGPALRRGREGRPSQASDTRGTHTRSSGHTFNASSNSTVALCFAPEYQLEQQRQKNTTSSSTGHTINARSTTTRDLQPEHGSGQQDRKNKTSSSTSHTINARSTTARDLQPEHGLGQQDRKNKTSSSTSHTINARSTTARDLQPEHGSGQQDRKNKTSSSTSDLRKQLIIQARESEKLDVVELAKKIGGVKPEEIEAYLSADKGGVPSLPPDIIANIEKELKKLLRKE